MVFSQYLSVVRIISVGKDNPIKFLWRKFNSLDFFTKLLIITIILLVLATPFIVNNYQLFHARGQTQAQALQEIQRLQQSQNNLQNSISSSSIKLAVPAEKADIATPSPVKGFNLIDALQKILIYIAQIFK